MRIKRATKVIIIIAIVGAVYYLNPFRSSPTGFVIVNTYPHDPESFTQGLEVHDEKLIEGTGLYGQSSLRWVDIESGEVTNSLELSPEYFGEGVTVLDDRIYQLTWKEETCFVYDLDFVLETSFSYNGEGWGLSNNGTHLIMSDGSSEIKFIDPETFNISRTIDVTNEGTPVENLNELEYVDGVLYSNIWMTDEIVLIDIETGDVIEVKEMSSLKTDLDENTIDVLNGIAFDPVSDTFYLTGKLWPVLFEVKFD